MARRSPEALSPPEARYGFWDAFGLSKPDGRGDWIDRNRQLREIQTTLPVALFIQVMAAGLMLATVILARHIELIVWVTSASTAVLAATLALGICLWVPPMRRWQTHHHMRLVVLLGTIQAAGLCSLLWATTRLPPAHFQLAAFTSVVGALGVTAISVHAVRAAMLAFATTIVGCVILFVGICQASLIALACLACLAVFTRRLARLDFDLARQDAELGSDGRLAAQLVREFESHGTGWFWQTDQDGNISYLSAKVAEALAIDGESPIGRSLTTVFRMDSAAPGTERTLGFHLSSRTAFNDYSVRAAGNRPTDRWWSISGRPVTDSFGRFQGFIGSGSDLTEKRRADAEITRLALFDSLTGLANRQRMRLSLDQTLNQPGPMRRPTALMLLDLDRFKVVNDTLGHQVGDALLKQVGQRLSRSVGETGLIGRLGGDEFKIVLPGENNADKLSELARTIIGALSQPYSIDGASISIGCSIGIAIAPNDGDDSETLIRNADLALYAAKADGRGVHRFYRAELLHGAQNRKQLEDDLRDALYRNEFHLVYQPVVSTLDQRIVAYEALLRWEHPVRGAISPTEFVPIAEDCGLIETIGEWVLRTACMDASAWPRHIRVGVNVSPIQFANPALPTIVTNALAKSGIAADRLELEITEGVFLDGGEQTDHMFRTLKSVGVRLALDDFGTGYSSLGYLKNAPFDKIKIDQSFVRGAAIAGNRNAPIIRAIVTLADTLGMETTAEGVEVQDEIELICDLGCSHIQGFVYGRPGRAGDVIRQLQEGEGYATPSGYRVSRSPRTAMIRSAIIEVGSRRVEVRIRNISSHGAMIDGVELASDTGGRPLMIELVEGQMFPARVRWARDRKAGIEFLEPFNLSRLSQINDQRHLRKTG